MFLTQVRIADSMRFGQEGRGWEIARTTLAFERSDGDPVSGSGGAPGRDVGSIIERYGPLTIRGCGPVWSMPGSENKWAGRLSAMLREQSAAKVVSQGQTGRSRSCTTLSIANGCRSC